MTTWDDKPNDYEHALVIIERLRAALQLIDDYYQTGGDLMSHVSHIAQDALAGVPLSCDE